MRTKKIATFGAVAALSCGLVGGFTTIPAAFADQSVPQSESTPTNAGHSYSDGAVISFPSEWKEGQPLNFQGSGFKTADGKSGSVLAIKVNGGGALALFLGARASRLAIRLRSTCSPVRLKRAT